MRRQRRGPFRSLSTPSAHTFELLVEQPIFLVNLLSQTTFVKLIVTLSVVLCWLPVTDRRLLSVRLESSGVE